MEQAWILVKSISESELDYISMADYGQNALQHKEALRKLIFDQNGVVNADQYWYPYEVVELSRWSCKLGHEREFAICNVIIGLSIINGADGHNSIERMFETLSNEYENLPFELKEIVTSTLFLAHEYELKR